MHIIFQDSSTYQYNPEILNQLTEQFQKFKTLIRTIRENVKKIIDKNVDEKALLIGHLLDYNFLEFEIWMKSNEDFNESNKIYIDEIIDIDIKHMKTYKKEIKKYDAPQLQALNDILVKQKQYAIEQQKRMNSLMFAMYNRLIGYNVALRKYIEIDSVLYVRNINSIQLQNVVDDLKVIFSQDMEKKLGIVKIVTDCELAFDEMIEIVHCAKVNISHFPQKPVPVQVQVHHIEEKVKKKNRFQKFKKSFKGFNTYFTS